MAVGVGAFCQRLPSAHVGDGPAHEVDLLVEGVSDWPARRKGFTSRSVALEQSPSPRQALVES